MCEQKNYFAAAMVFSSGLGFAAKMVQPPKIEKNNLQDKSE